MATIIVEDGSGISNSNSYVTLAEADLYFSEKGELGWAGTDDFKNQNLINATTSMDALYGPRYISFLRDQTIQALLWPREQIWDRHSRRIDNGDIPFKLQDAQCEIALLAQNGVDIYPSGTIDNQLTATSVTIGDISESKSFQKVPQDQASYEGFREIELILWAILLPVNKKMAFAI